MRDALLFPLLLALAAPAACHAQQSPGQGSGDTTNLPALTGRVVDAANILAPADEAALAAASAAMERDTRHQFAIVTVPDLHGEAIEKFGLRLGRYWGIGEQGIDDGLLLIVAPRERQVRIEVGYGLEKRVTDAFAAKVIRDDMLPLFRTGDLPGAIRTGSADLIARLRSRASDRQIAAEDRMVI